MVFKYFKGFLSYGGLKLVSADWAMFMFSEHGQHPHQVDPKVLLVCLGT